MLSIKTLLIFTAFIVFSLLFSCKKDSLENQVKVDHMVLIYMAANNNLRQDAINCLNKIESGFTGKQRLLVYIKTNSENSYILKIKHDKTDKIVSDTIQIYGNENSSDPHLLSRVIKDARRYAPATSYGLILWSHASSWAPAGIRTKSFGEDRGTDMDIIDLKNALPSDFSYIIFDACSMASIEAIYELKNKTRYILASPTEVLSTSYPYEQIVPYLSADRDNLKIIGQKFIDYYKSLNGDYASATVSLIATENLALLAQKTKELLDLKRPTGSFNVVGIQRLDFDPTSRIIAYDFLDFLVHNYNPDDFASIKNQLNNVILFKGNTSSFLNSPIKTFSGISIYLPKADDPFQDYYSKLEWYRSGAGYNIFRR